MREWLGDYPAKGCCIASSESVIGFWGRLLILVQLCWPLSALQPLMSLHCSLQ